MLSLFNISILFLLVLFHFIFLHSYVNENMAFPQQIAKQNYILRKKALFQLTFLMVLV